MDKEQRKIIVKDLKRQANRIEHREQEFACIGLHRDTRNIFEAMFKSGAEAMGPLHFQKERWIIEELGYDAMAIEDWRAEEVVSRRVMALLLCAHLVEIGAWG
jgi:hypothetical protein